MDGVEFEGGVPDPIRKGGRIEIDTLTAVNLGLTVKRKMVGILADQNMRHSRLGRHAARDQSCRGGGLRDTI